MSETQLLRSSAIIRHAPSPVSTAHAHAELSKPQAHPIVQVNMTANGPQVHGGGQAGKSVAVMPRRDARQPHSASGLPVVQVQMTGNGPEVQGAPAAQAPRVAISPPPASQGWVQNAVRGVPENRVRVPRPVQVFQEPQLSQDELLLFRHLLNKSLEEQRAAAAAKAGDPPTESAEGAEAAPAADEVTESFKLAEGTIAKLDEIMSTRTAAETAQAASDSVATVELLDAPPPVVVEAGAPSKPFAAASRPALRTVVVGRGSVQSNASVTPRRVARQDIPPQSAPRGPLPMVNVKMDNGRPVQVAGAQQRRPAPAPAAPVGSDDAQG